MMHLDPRTMAVMQAAQTAALLAAKLKAIRDRRRDRVDAVLCCVRVFEGGRGDRRGRQRVWNGLVVESLRAAAVAEERIAVLEAELQRLSMETHDAERVTLRLQGRWHTPEAAPASTIPLASPTSLPRGCIMLEGVVPMDLIEQEVDALTSAVLNHGTAITAGQGDKRRLQLKQDATNLPFADLVRPALEGACPGRELAEVNTICSRPPCQQQKVHYDYNPDHVQILAPARKPRSAMLSLMWGTRLIVYDSVLGHLVLVPIPPGCILLFDGDVAHAGAAYHAQNTRVHVYMDAEGVDRASDYTWFKV
jgi:hypothetical protein